MVRKLRKNVIWQKKCFLLLVVPVYSEVNIINFRTYPRVHVHGVKETLLILCPEYEIPCVLPVLLEVV